MVDGVAPQVTFSVIVPTAGRPTLGYTLESIVSQIEPGDEVFVIRDDSGDWGHSARDDAIARATGTHLVFMDDDDEFLPGALATMRRFAEDNEGRIGIFRQRRVLYGRGGEIRRVGEMWHDRDLDQTATSTYCVPNVPGKLGRFHDHVEDVRRGDVAFIRETVALQGEPVWREECTTIVKPERSRWRRLRYRIALRTRLRRLLGRRRHTGS
jgi:glycosyltransferase involved in cell wall biosynthesis